MHSEHAHYHYNDGWNVITSENLKNRNVSSEALFKTIFETMIRFTYHFYHAMNIALQADADEKISIS